MDKLPIIDKYVARLLMISFFLPMHWQVIAVFASCVYFVIRAFSTGQQIPRSKYTWALVLGSGYLLFLFSFFITPQPYRATLSMICQQRASLLLMPFVFAIITPAFGKDIKKELNWFVYGCLLSCIIGNVGFIYEYLYAPGMHLLTHTAYRITFEDVTGIHPTYMAMYMAFSVCILLFSPHFITRAEIIAKYALLYVLLIFFVFLLAKSLLIALGVIFILYGWQQREKLLLHKLLIGGMLGSVAAAIFFIPFVWQRIQEVLSYIGIGRPQSTVDNSVYIRKLIWDEDTSLLRANWRTGVGPGRVLHLLDQRYFFYSIGHGFNVGYYDPHNEYFFVWLCFGVIGIFLFIVVLVMLFVKAIRAKDHLFTYLLIILSIAFSTETVLSRQRGVLFFAIFTSMLFFLNSYNKPGKRKQYQHGREKIE